MKMHFPSQFIGNGHLYFQYFFIKMNPDAVQIDPEATLGTGSPGFAFQKSAHIGTPGIPYSFSIHDVGKNEMATRIDVSLELLQINILAHPKALGEVDPGGNAVAQVVQIAVQGKGVPISFTNIGSVSKVEARQPRPQFAIRFEPSPGALSGVRMAGQKTRHDDLSFGVHNGSGFNFRAGFPLPDLCYAAFGIHQEESNKRFLCLIGLGQSDDPCVLHEQAMGRAHSDGAIRQNECNYRKE